ncbi:MAG: hypothetical protein ACI810_002005 [Gammaproteobacteria bacterium]|jgi:hypothetical protein
MNKRKPFQTFTKEFKLEVVRLMQVTRPDRMFACTKELGD